MCGLIVAYSSVSPLHRTHFNDARDAMFHRGPDAGGSEFFNNDLVALGHRRLSIQDLSEAANQPLQMEDLWIVFNGEIYNFPELRKELESHGRVFKTGSDTEVLIHGYRVWGRELCSRLEGMFAFAVYDARSEEFFLARDHVGQKPLHYAIVDGVFVAASEIKAIRSLMRRDFTRRKEAVLEHIIYDFVPEPNTWFEEIKCVKPGHYMVLRKNGSGFHVEEHSYWSYLPPLEPARITPADAMELLDQEIRRSVQAHLIADVEVGALLSGGVDSGSIVAIASEVLSDPVQTFSIGFGTRDGDELPLAQQVADLYNTKHTVSIVKEDEYQSGIKGILDIFDQPFADTSLVPTKAVSDVASKSVKVVLTGDGGDEAFGGYNLGVYISPMLDQELWRNYGFNRKSVNETLSFIKNLSFYLTHSEKQWATRKHYPRYLSSIRRDTRIMPEALKRTLKEYNYSWMYDENTVEGLDAFRQAQWHHLKFILPGKMLAKVDRCSMQHSIEARAPFLSHKLIEAMLNLPTEIKNPKSQWYKGLFRTWAKDKLPHDVLFAPKRGFDTPQHWNALPDLENTFAALSNLRQQGIVHEQAWPELRRKKRLLWKMLQVEHAISNGLF